MSSKLTMKDVMTANCRISNEVMLTSNHCAALARELNAILAAPVVERQPVRNASEVAYNLQAELAELQATIAKLTAENERLKGGQGEPVAICRLWNEGGSGERTSVEWINSPCSDGSLLYASKPAPVSADVVHDRAYRNGLMAGFQFGISGNEKGYALAIANFNAEIHEAKIEQPAPVSVVLPERKTEGFMAIGDKDIIDLRAEGWNACLDKVKELNQ